MKNKMNNANMSFGWFLILDPKFEGVKFHIQ